MSKSRSSVVALCLAVLSVLLVPALGADAIRRDFEVYPGGLLTVRAERASIDVSAGQSGVATVEIVPRGASLQSLREEYDIDLRQSGNEVIVEIRSRGRWSRWFNWGGRRLDVVVTVPLEFNVDLTTSGGGVTVEDLRGEARATTSGGSIRLGRIEGPTWARTSGGGIEFSSGLGDASLRTSGGSIRVGDVTGNLEARTSGGSISVQRASGQIRAETSGGSIKVEDVAGSIDARTSGGSVEARITSQPEGDCYLGTSGGGVRVSIAPDLRFNVDARTSGGRVRSALPLQVSGTLGGSRVEGELNGGGPKLTLRTSGGNIQLE